MRDTSEAGLKRRMKKHIEGLPGWSLAKLAKETGDTYKNVRRWVSEDTTVPGDFIARYVDKVPVNARWLLLGEEKSAPGSAAEMRADYSGSLAPIDEPERLWLSATLSEIARIVAESERVPLPTESPSESEIEEILTRTVPEIEQGEQAAATEEDSTRTDTQPDHTRNDTGESDPYQDRN